MDRMALLDTSAGDRAPGITPGWLRDADFDLAFCGGLAALALASGLLLSLRPELYPIVVFTDFWLLGYQHVIATFTRLCFDRASFARHRFLVTRLPPLVIAAVLLVAFGVGFWAVATIYFYWQWWHTARQSWGIAQMYRRQGEGRADEDPRWAQLVFYAVPVWGILHRSQQHPDHFLGLDVALVPVPEALVDVVGIAAMALLAIWVGRRILAWRRGALPLAHTLYMLTHFMLFAVGYLLIDNVDAGWVVTNIWHTGQYLMIVWLFNANRFKAGVDAAAPLLSALAQPAAAWRYVLLCLALSTLLYGTIVAAEGVFPTAATLIAIAAAQSLNFHHFIVDAVIWRRPRSGTPAIPAVSH
jgi:hypothetical protein